MPALLTNDADTVLAAGITNVATSMDVLTGKGALFPVTGTDYFYVTLREGALVEIVKVTARATDTFTITRAQDNTTAKTFTTAATVKLSLTAAVMAEKQATLVSGTNIKTVGGVSLMGGGDIVVAHGSSLSGATTISAGQVIAYTITDFDSFSTYAVSVSAGSVTRTGEAISFTAPATAQAVTLTVTTNGVARAIALTVLAGPIYIATPTATPAAFGDPLEGGFYAGMIWNELVQSATSFVIGTGSKVFTVADMTATPLVYVNQTLEVRSRANPANKMIGVVTNAIGTELTINVTSVGGSGTFTDWSIMAQYRVIVAPKSTGENVSIIYKNANDAAPAACGTLSEGRKATLAMVAAGTGTVYPAAHWCNNLNIAGRTDWYLPARDELELCWRNLKPTVDANFTDPWRPTNSTLNYMNLGSYGDVAAAPGIANNTSPVGAAHTAGDPAQVAAGKNFRTGESEAFAYGSFYWSSSEFDATRAWRQHWESQYPGLQACIDKAYHYYVRAVRRSII